ncbi:Oidioi.mRNA.OKI2018_I69.chr1.g1378.t1.cds [Oikopleura dioica]|uniref:Oidioi.mRNA.OKI2018_I69.chr1.g1378.t1.cds n=1 Tax=Oikopleura dioica TaxID=34765 RepID=A0ABN7SMQ6_OIKDI|nr:Oidioi.mRNA.OKI2018_I69.chr1.g1378.t1.cds [Oikopleura dioica]
MQQKTHDREDTGIIQIVLFPPIELPRKSFADEEEDRRNGIKISTFHVAREVWVEPRRGNLAKGPPGCEGKNFLEIAQIQMTRDHQMIIFEMTYNLIKAQCRAKKPWDSSFAFKDLKQNSKPAGFENTSGVKEVKMKYLDYSLDEEFENRMDRVFFMNNTHDIEKMLYHGNHRLFGFSLLESTTEDKNQPNPGNEELLHQFHAVLKIRSDFSLVLDSVENMKCPIQEFLCEMLGIRKRDHKESRSTVTDYDNYEEDQLYDGNYDSDEDYDDKEHSAGSCDGGLPRSNMNNTPHWAVYARYVDEKDTFDKINLPEDEPRNSDVQGVVSDSEEADSRLRKDSEVSFCRSSYTSDGILDLQNRKHRGMLPVLVTVAERAKVREAINKMKPMNKKMTVMNKCWKPELTESMKKQESVRHERNNSFSPEDLYNRSFVRGVYHTLGEKSVSSDPLVSSTDFHIAFYEHCVPEEKKIVITDAILLPAKNSDQC